VGVNEATIGAAAWPAERSSRGDGAPPARPGAVVDPAFWRDRRVLVTGHTGFKGSWLTLWLQTLGADVTGFALAPPTSPSLFELACVAEGMTSVEGDVRAFDTLSAAIAAARPEIVIHLAAQSLVRRALARPRETYEVNLMGTVNLLETLRGSEDTRAAVLITSDKCYENREWEWGYREHERMSGQDPYSSSKGCAELAIEAFRCSLFTSGDAPRVASARAGNVIGGGDWSEDRLVADAMRGALAGQPLRVRNPDSIRPWQHVLNPLSGYLQLAQALWSSEEFACGWNFGPAWEDEQPVRAILERISTLWPQRLHWVADPGPHPHEARYLKLDSSRALSRLGWRPRWNLQEGLTAVVDWYRALGAREDMRAVTVAQIEAFQRVQLPV
jgi:CDP-glucose 4,6-dehydratase